MAHEGGIVAAGTSLVKDHTVRANHITAPFTLRNHVFAGSNPALRTAKGDYMPKSGNKKFVYHYMKYQKILTKEELRLHNCFHKKKGKRKGKPCSLLIRLPTP